MKKFTVLYVFALLVFMDVSLVSADICVYDDLWRVGTITTGDGDDTVIVNGIILESTLDTGLGSDDISVHGFILRGQILAGEGDNIINISEYAHNSTITSGTGNDIITIGGKETRLNLNSGAGEDEISINGQLYEGSLLTGEGNDILKVNTTDFVRAYIDMGPDNDILEFSGGMSDYNITGIYYHSYVFGAANRTLHIYNVETIVFGDGNSIPEPATILLLGIGGLFIKRRRRR